MACRELESAGPRAPSGSGRRAEEDAGFALIGRTVGSFRIIEQLGSGATGSVFLACHPLIGSKVAVKFLHPRLCSNPQLVAQFQDEARAVNVVGHPNIISIFDMGVSPPSDLYLVMEYLEGRPLSSLRGPVPASVAVPILAQVCDALEAAHRVGVVHRDVKPDNVFLLRRGRSNFVKLLDFGAAQLRRAPRRGGVGESGLVMGSPPYMPPEQWLGGPIDGRTDVYALGVTAYLLATGRLPFETRCVPLAQIFRRHRDELPPPPAQVNPGVPRALSEAIVRALAKRPEDRFSSAGELGAALRAVLSRRKKARSLEESLSPALLPCGAVGELEGNHPVGGRDSPNWSGTLRQLPPPA